MALNAWLAGNSNAAAYQATNLAVRGHYLNQIYAYNSIPTAYNIYPAILLKSGFQLPSAGLTVATPQPLFVRGNYNISNTVAATIQADSVTAISTNFVYAAYPGTTNARPATAVTINAALIEGVIPGGTNTLDNYLWLQEDWSGSSLAYTGTILVNTNCQFMNGAVWPSATVCVPNFTNLNYSVYTATNPLPTVLVSTTGTPPPFTPPFTFTTNTFPWGIVSSLQGVFNGVTNTLHFTNGVLGGISQP
jgi:hypothetical protein